MPGYPSEESTPELAALIEWQASTDGDLTDLYRDLPGPDFLMAATTNPNDKVERSPQTGTEFPPSSEAISGCLASITDQNSIEPRLLLETLSPSYPAACSATPVLFTSGCGSPDGTGPCGMGYPHSDSTIPLNDLNRNSLDAQMFHHYIIKPADPDLRPDSILDWYGQDHRSPQDESFQRDKELLEKYIQSNSKLTAQLAFMRNQRKKKQTDSNLVEGYRFIVSLHTTLRRMEFKPPPHQHVSSKAILTCLDVTPSWLSRARHVVKLLKKIGPDGSSPDPLVMKRLRSKEVTHKGSDLLTFLKQQDRLPKDTCSP